MDDETITALIKELQQNVQKLVDLNSEPILPTEEQRRQMEEEETNQTMKTRSQTHDHHPPRHPA